jgi:hypothetical protein
MDHPAELPATLLLEEYTQTLHGKAPPTIDVYVRVLRQLMAWMAERPGSGVRLSLTVV